MLTFETDDFSHEPRNNPVEGKSLKIMQKNSKSMK